jgi:hypothetical protein
MSSSLVLDLLPENYEPYLKMITESIVITSHNDGSLRKDMWSYLMNKYSADIDYGQFLLAIRKFMNQGRMTNKNGYHSMHDEVLTEFSKNPSANSDAAVKIIKEIVKKSKNHVNKTSVHRKKLKKDVSDISEISEGHVTKQSKIDKYYTRKQDFFDGEKWIAEKGLGFATPILEVRKDLIQESLKKSEKSGGRHNNILTQIAESEASPEREISKTVVNLGNGGNINPFLTSQSNLGRNTFSQKGTSLKRGKKSLI